MKNIKFLMILAFGLINMIGVSQTTILEYDNTINTQYKIKCTWEANGITYSTGGIGYELIQGNTSGEIEIAQNNAVLVSFKITTADCTNLWLLFIGGTSSAHQIGECLQCPTPYAAAYYDGNTEPGHVKIHCRQQ